MTTFDGTPAGAHAGPFDGEFPSPPPAESRFDAFELLREQLDERDEEFKRTVYVEVPGIGWRLECAIDFGYPAYKEWQKASLPRSQRNGRKVNALDMDQALLSHFVLFNTCEGIEYQRSDNGEWESLTEDNDQPATLQSGKMLTRMNVVDPRLLTKRLFLSDARLIRAGTKVITEAGFAEPEEGDIADPTP